MHVYSDFWRNGGQLTLELWQAKDAALARPPAGWRAALAAQLLALPELADPPVPPPAAACPVRAARLAEALATADGNVTRAAAALGVSRTTLYRWERQQAARSAAAD